MQAKVKLIDKNTGQEFFLLVTKLNLKGLRVESAHPLQVGSRTNLSLQLGDIYGTLQLEGEVHKILSKPKGGCGIIVRFIDPPGSAIKRLTSYLAAQSVAQQSPSSSARGTPSAEKTMMVDVNQLSRLYAPSELSDKPALSSTRDEEESDEPGFSGSTRITSQDEFNLPFRKSRRRKKSSKAPYFFTIGILILLGVGWVWFVDRRTLPPAPVVVIRPATPTPESTAAPVVASTPKPRTPTPPEPVPDEPAPPKVRPDSFRITGIETQDGGAFLKVLVQGTGGLSNVDVSRAMNPKRLILTFPDVKSYGVKPAISVNKNPLLRIRTKSEEKSIRVVFDLYPLPFPRYEVKTRPESAEIFLHR